MNNSHLNILEQKRHTRDTFSTIRSYKNSAVKRIVSTCVTDLHSERRKCKAIVLYCSVSLVANVNNLSAILGIKQWLNKLTSYFAFSVIFVEIAYISSSGVRNVFLNLYSIVEVAATDLHLVTNNVEFLFRDAQCYILSYTYVFPFP